MCSHGSSRASVLLLTKDAQAMSFCILNTFMLFDPQLWAMAHRNPQLSSFGRTTAQLIAFASRCLRMRMQRHCYENSSWQVDRREAIRWPFLKYVQTCSNHAPFRIHGLEGPKLSTFEVWRQGTGFLRLQYAWWIWWQDMARHGVEAITLSRFRLALLAILSTLLGLGGMTGRCCQIVWTSLNMDPLKISAWQTLLGFDHTWLSKRLN